MSPWVLGCCGHSQAPPCLPAVAALTQQFTAANLRRPGKLFGAARDLVLLVEQGHGGEICRQQAILVVLARMTGSGYATDSQQAALGE